MGEWKAVELRGLLSLFSPSTTRFISTCTCTQILTPPQSLAISLLCTNFTLFFLSLYLFVSAFLQYLLALNHAVGRSTMDARLSAVLPWVSDLTMPWGGWRDLGKSKLRITKANCRRPSHSQKRQAFIGAAFSTSSSSPPNCEATLTLELELHHQSINQSINQSKGRRVSGHDVSPAPGARLLLHLLILHSAAPRGRVFERARLLHVRGAAGKYGEPAKGRAL
jgi:hypothetical protein